MTAAGQCLVCADAADLVRVLDPVPPDALCEDGCGRRVRVAIELVGPVAAGERLVVHAGVAIGRMP